MLVSFPQSQEMEVPDMNGGKSFFFVSGRTLEKEKEKKSGEIKDL